MGGQVQSLATLIFWAAMAEPLAIVRTRAQKRKTLRNMMSELLQLRAAPQLSFRGKRLQAFSFMI